jgi:hypothetical protein
MGPERRMLPIPKTHGRAISLTHQLLHLHSCLTIGFCPEGLTISTNALPAVYVTI